MILQQRNNSKKFSREKGRHFEAIISFINYELKPIYSKSMTIIHKDTFSDGGLNAIIDSLNNFCILSLGNI